MLMQWKSTGMRAMTVDEYRELMGLEKGQYRLFADLRRRTIDPAIKEINEKTTWHCELDYKRRGKSIQSLLFTFKLEDQMSLDL